MQVVGRLDGARGVLSRGGGIGGDGAEMMWIRTVVSGDAGQSSAPVILAGPVPWMSAHQPGGPIRARAPSSARIDAQTAMPVVAGATHHPIPRVPRSVRVPWNQRPTTLGRGRGVGVKLLVRAGSEKCRDVRGDVTLGGAV